jgi:hypothetical protein
MESGEYRPSDFAGRSNNDAELGRGKGDATSNDKKKRTLSPTGRSVASRLRRSKRIRGATIRRWSKPPWRKLPKLALQRERLRQWRKWAHDAAVHKGARRACGLCKRAIMGCAFVEIRPPWKTARSKLRNLCTECWRELSTLIDQTEYTRDNYDKDIDWTASKGQGPHAATPAE